MFRPMILEGAAHVWQQGHQQDVSHKDGNAQEALKNRAPGGDVSGKGFLQQVKEDCGQEKEQQNGKGHAQHAANCHHRPGKLFPQVIIQPLVQAGKLLFPVLLRQLVRGDG